MKTFWGEVPVADAHVHFFSHAFFSALAAQRGGPASSDPEAAVEQIARILDWTAPPPEPPQLARIWARELDRHGVGRAALIASVPGDEPSVVAAVTTCPERFYGYFMLNPLAPEAIDRLEGALTAGLQGIGLFPAMHRYS